MIVQKGICKKRSFRKRVWFFKEWKTEVEREWMLCEECTWREERNRNSTGEVGGLCMNGEISVTDQQPLAFSLFWPIWTHFGPKKRGKEQRPKLYRVLNPPLIHTATCHVPRTWSSHSLPFIQFYSILWLDRMSGGGCFSHYLVGNFAPLWVSMISSANLWRS